MHRYLMLLGVAIVTISVFGGALQLSTSYNTYYSHLQAAGSAAGTSVTVLDEARWQVAQILGVGIIAGGTIAGSILMGLSWIGHTMEHLRDALGGELIGESKPAEVVSE